ncbi:DUF6575 domain-containing protein [Photobacterium sanguinicancri]|uniref:DUF6575 domain-containing protein n=1 Tax=Photobacterium sanguinicancri TaxID=875932 RepID=UPI0026E3A3FE|nr:DUF6575 domain-containing protein [Photobacterium sanguinicancri]MDO6496841.1 hypothetical protein [Photobacterium sanguinicancri]
MFKYLKDEIKNLKPWEIFEFYDGPRFYSCKSQLGQIYLVYWVDETECADQWLYVKVSAERYYELKNRRIPIYKALVESEEKYSLLITVNNNKEFELRPIQAFDFDPDWLPDETEFVNIDNKSTLLPEKLTDVQTASSSSYRQVLDLALVTANNSYELAAGNLGNILTKVQNFLYASACDNRLNIRKVPDLIKEEQTMNVTTLFASSFGIRLQSKNTDFFENSVSENNLENFMSLLSSINDHEILHEKLSQMNLLTRSRFKALVKELVDNELSIKSEWANPYGKFNANNIEYIALKFALNNIKNGFDSNTQINTYKKVTLVGVDVHSDFFALKTNDKNIIKGKLSKDLESYNFNIPSVLDVTIEETCKIHETSGHEVWSYILMKVN